MVQIYNAAIRLVDHLLLFVVVADSDKGHKEVCEYLLVPRVLLRCLGIQIHHLLLWMERRERVVLNLVTRAKGQVTFERFLGCCAAE